MLHLLEVQYRGSDLEDGLIADLNGVGAWVKGGALGKVEGPLATARGEGAHTETGE